MTPFLKQIAKLFYDKYGAEIQRLAFVFPNRRSGIFFRKFLSEAASKPLFSPSILTIKDLFYKLNPKQQADPVKLLFQLYDIYSRRSDSPETFDDFVHWGKMLLNDFDDIDKYLLDAKQLFTNVTDLNRIERDFSFLNPSQVQAIRSFWSTFSPESNDANKQFFLRVWELLYPVYVELRETLAAEGFAYEGMIYREVVENLEMTSTSKSLPYEKIIFVGLNALTNAERELLKHFKKQGIADFYWDYASEKVKDPDNRASYFMKDNLSLFPSAYTLSNRASTLNTPPLPKKPVKRDANFMYDLFSSAYNVPDDNISPLSSANIFSDEEPVETQFELIGIPSRIGQAKQIYPILENLFGLNKISTGETLQTSNSFLPLQKISADEALKTAIVLPDEQLLLPVLHSIPPQIERINVTLGFSLSGTPVASLMNYLQSLQKNVRITEHDTMFYHSDVIAVLRHQYVSPSCPTEAATIMQDINERNQVYISESVLWVTPLLKLLFSAPSNVMELSDYLRDVLIKVGESDFVKENEFVGETGEIGEEAAVNTRALEREFIYHFYKIVNRMKDLLQTIQTDLSTDTYFRLLKQMTDFIKIPFYGEPLSGLQVMGALETRVLDFENLIILSVNEGIFPAKSISASFIPYHLRRGFGLPTPEHQESIWAYHFYRMIYRAKRVIMLYDTRTDGLQSGEVSRFVHQLRYHYQTPVKQKLSVYNVASPFIKPFKVDKDEEVMCALARYETEKSLSASAINTYLDCPFKFYLMMIKGIDEEKAVSETLRHDLFGTLLHRVMELAYKPFCGSTVTADLLKLVTQEKNMTELIWKAFAKDYYHTDVLRPLTGQAYLYGETIRKYAGKIIEYDRSLTPFIYIGSEKPVNRTIEITGGRKVRIKGFIDRIDSVDGTVRIVDYKSGRPDALAFTTIESLFDKTEKDRKKAIMQVFLYAWIYASETGICEIQPAIYYAINLFKESDFNPFVYQALEKEITVIDCFNNEYPAFEDSLRACLNELFDVSNPFTLTPIVKHCEYCPFKGICGR